MHAAGLWGAAIQIPALRPAKAGPFGDFGDLVSAVPLFAERGAKGLTICGRNADKGRAKAAEITERYELTYDPAQADARVRAVITRVKPTGRAASTASAGRWAGRSGA